MTYSWYEKAALDWLTCFWRPFWLALTCFSQRGQFGQWAILARISHLAITLLSRLCSSNCPLLSSSKHHRYCWHWSHLVGSGGGISVNINVVTIFPPKSFSSKWGLELVHTQPDTSFTQTKHTTHCFAKKTLHQQCSADAWEVSRCPRHCVITHKAANYYINLLWSQS